MQKCCTHPLESLGGVCSVCVDIVHIQTSADQNDCTRAKMFSHLPRRDELVIDVPNIVLDELVALQLEDLGVVVGQ